MITMAKRKFLSLAAVSLLAMMLVPRSATAQVKTRISIATAGTGGVYYPLDGGPR